MTYTTLHGEVVEVGPPPPLDAESGVALAAIPAEFRRPVTPDTIKQFRQDLVLATCPDEVYVRGGTYTMDEKTVVRGAGAPELRVMVCRPTSSPGPFPALYYVHGSGMMVGGLRSPDTANAMALAERVGAVYVGIDYRVAPESPFPAAVDDAYAGLLWVVDNAADLGVDPGRIVLIGCSGGGGIGAGVTLMARDRGGPALAGQMLLCPMLDDRNDTPSAIQMAAGGTWNQTSNQTGWSALLGDACGGPAVSAYAAPARAIDLSGLPPTFIDVGSAETFRDESVEFAQRIWLAGGAAELHVWPGGFHGYDVLAPHTSLAQATQDARVPWLRRVTGR